MEGGSRMGNDIFTMIADYGGRGKILDVHFRNVSSPLPRFVETFPDNRYVNRYQVMKALRQVRFSGIIVPDHVPEFAGDGGMHRVDAWTPPPRQPSAAPTPRRANEEVG